MIFTAILFPIFFPNLDQSFTVLLAKLHTKQDISHFFLQILVQDSAQELFQHTILPYLGVSRIEFQFCCLQTRFVSQGGFCFHSAGFGGPWTFTVIFLNVSRLVVPPYLFLCIHHLPR
jgi:hypothetical protein